MLRNILTLLAAQRISLWNNWKWANQRQRLIFGAAAGFGVLLVFGNLLFAFFIVNLPKFLASINSRDPNIQALVSAVNPSALVGQVLNFFFVGAMVFLLFDAVSSALPNLYQANDLPLLLSSPVPADAVFGAKLVGGLLRPYMLLFGLGLPYLIGVGLGLGYGPLYYPLAVVAILLLPLIPAGVGALLTAALVRRVPAYRLSEALELVGGLIGLLLAGVIVVLGVQSYTSGRPEGATNTLLTASAATDIGWLPTSWAVYALQAAGVGDWAALAGWGLLYVVAAVGIFVGCALIATRLFYAGWVNINITGGASRAALRAKRAALPHLSVEQVVDNIRNEGGKPARPLLASLRAVLGKDSIELRREPTAVVQLLGPTLIGLVFILQWRTRVQLSSVNVGVQLQAFTISCLWLIFLSSFSAGLFGLNSFSREQKSIWMLKIAPVSVNRLLFAKFMLTYALLLAFGISFSLLYSLLAGATPAQLLGFIGVIVAGGVGAAAISVGIGATVPRLNTTSRIISLTAGVVSLFVLLIYIMMLLGCVYALGYLRGFLDTVPARAVALLIGLSIIAFFTFVPLLLAKKRLEKLEL